MNSLFQLLLRQTEKRCGRFCHLPSSRSMLLDAACSLRFVRLRRKCFTGDIHRRESESSQVPLRMFGRCAYHRGAEPVGACSIALRLNLFDRCCPRGPQYFRAKGVSRSVRLYDSDLLLAAVLGISGAVCGAVLSLIEFESRHCGQNFRGTGLAGSPK